jgi:hypothetical protein
MWKNRRIEDDIFQIYVKYNERALKESPYRYPNEIL